MIKKMMDETKANIMEVFDIKTMAIEALTSDKELLNQMFLQCGAQEFDFIRASGFWFGLILGLIQMGIFVVYR